MFECLSKPVSSGITLTLLAEAYGVSKQEATVRAISEAAQRRLREGEVRELSAADVGS